MKGRERQKAAVVAMVEIELDKKRMLDFDLNALTAAEKAMSDFWGKRITMGTILSEGVVGAADLRAMIWAGLLHEDEDLTLEDVGEMVNINNMEYVQKKLMEGLSVQGVVQPTNNDGAPGGGSDTPNPPGK